MSTASNYTFSRGVGSERFFRVIAVLDAMKRSGLSDEFVFHLFRLSKEYDGTYELMLMWFTESDEEVCDEIIADLQGEIEEEISEPILPNNLKKEDCFHFDNLEAIAINVMQFKKALRLVVERKGGLNKLAEKTKIPRPSLSRFFNTPSLPRRNTLKKIAQALELKRNSEEYKLLKKWLNE
ncbi:MAG: hypothetical protein K940chlam9_01481 [Chlamydiae bacterium]|nr:hypothetical protein [Chlamydiota bacterium]